MFQLLLGPSFVERSKGFQVQAVMDRLKAVGLTQEFTVSRLALQPVAGGHNVQVLF